jgi:hypothetical protein
MRFSLRELARVGQRAVVDDASAMVNRLQIHQAHTVE